MVNIKPINTIFKGYRFRSRLEARWAVFFDAAQINFEYELDGFQLSNGAQYLPDFFLPDLGIFVEVKPPIAFRLDELKKMIGFAADDDHPLLLIHGSPTAEHMYLLSRAVLDSWDMFIGDNDENDVDLLNALFLESLDEWASVQFGYLPLIRGPQLVYRKQPPLSNLDNPLIVAKQARFEFEEARR